MAEKKELKEAKEYLTMLSKATEKTLKYLGLEVKLGEDEKPLENEGETNLMEGALEVGEYMLPDGRKLIITEDGAEIEAKEPTEEEVAEMEREKTEMAAQKAKKEEEQLELSKKFEELVDANEKLMDKVTKLESAKALKGSPKQAVKEKKVITPNMSYKEAAAIRLENAGL